MVEENKVILYQNKKYVIVKMTTLYNTKYAFLVNEENEDDFFFGKFVNNELIEETDEQFLNLLIDKM